MKEHRTQRLFWKKWPYKAIIEVPARSIGGWTSRRTPNPDRTANITKIKDWCKKNLEDYGIRCETFVSVFVRTEEELNELLDQYGHRITEVWKPESVTAKDILLQHEYDVVRANPWYGKFTIRARINYNSDFRVKAVDNFRAAVRSLEPGDWHCAGLLKEVLQSDTIPSRFGWGQPLYLYLASAEDAAMLRLQCSEYIERFERIRPPA
jgi:hypothetical protein